MTEHVLDLQGTGFFSRGGCTGCDWALKGHAEEIRRVWTNYHADGNVLPLPARVTLPPVPENPVAQAIERRLIVLLTHRVDFGREEALHVAHGLAQARMMVLGERASDAGAYTADLMARVSSLSKRQREKLRHPARSREEQQRLLEVG